MAAIDPSKINDSIDVLIGSIRSSRKIWLNDHMLVLQLYNDKQFYDWIKDKKVMINGKEESAQPKIKKMHSVKWHKSYEKVGDRSGEDLTPIFMTVGIIKNGTSNIDYSCCKLQINNLGNNVFTKMDDSGIVLSGTYFFMSRHLANDSIYSPYGPKTVYGNRNYTDEHKPVGYYNHKLDRTGKVLPVLENSGKIGAIEPITAENSATRSFSLDWIKDVLGYLKIDSTGKVTVEKTFDTVADATKQVLMGHLLISDGNVLFDEQDMMPKCVMMKPIGLIRKYEIVKLSVLKPGLVGVPRSVADLIPMTPLEISNLRRGERVYAVNEKYVAETSYEFENLYPLFSINLFKAVYVDFPSIIPPGFLNHGSDLNPRICVILDNNDNFIAINLEGRHNVCGGIGIDLFDLAKICKTMGAKYALNLDGGDSAKMIYKEKGNMQNLLGFDRDMLGDSLSDYTISNAIVIKPK